MSRVNPMDVAYRAKQEAGLIKQDPAQAKTVAALGDLTARLARAKGGLLRKPPRVKGLYIWGGVGRGKSMLMDLFFDTVKTRKKRRIHFHDFMRETHEFLAYWRGLTPNERRRSQWRVKGAGDDPIAPAARKIAASAQLLCFDEFQVTQIADAMILKRLFENLFASGVTMVATSNRPPDDLYKDGINRNLFTPFIDLLKAHCDVLELVSDIDHRLAHLTEAPVWVTPLGASSQGALEAAWTRLTLGAPSMPARLCVQNRVLEVSRQAAGVAWLTFNELCAQPLGAADYGELAAHFHTIILADIPELSPAKRNEAIRFTTLIDVLYEAKVNLVASAAGEPDQLYTTGDGSFEFERTVSRLHEMRSADYIGAEHNTQPSSEATA